MNLAQLEYLVAVSDAGSFTEAAEIVHVTQSAISHSLSSLEQELGVSLLERSRKGIVDLTPVGKRILVHARLLAMQAGAIEQEAKAARGATAGKVRLGSIVSFVSPSLLAGLLTRFKRLYPNLDVVLFEGAMHEVGDWIESGVIDVGFVILPAPLPVTVRVLADELRVVMPANHRLVAKRSVAARDLAGDELIMEKTQCTLNLMKRAGLGAPMKRSVRHQASDVATILAMVREGLGITLLPAQLLPDKLNGLAALPLNPPHHVDLGLAVKSEESASRGALLFLEMAKTWAAAPNTARAL